MTSSTMDPVMPLLLALAICLVVIAALSWAVSHQRRRARREARRTTSSLARDFAAYLDDRIDRDELDRAVRDASEASYWTALESFAPRLDRGEWLRLSGALERNRHAAVERRALRDDSPWRRVLAAKRLGLMRSRSSRRALRRAMVHGPEVLTLAAAHGLARAGDRAALRWLVEHPGSLAHRPHPARVALFLAFGPAGAAVLAAALDGGPHPTSFERVLIETLGRSRRRSSRAAVERRLSAQELDLRVAAARALGELRSPASADALMSALHDDAWQVRAQAARALGRVRAANAVLALTARLGDPSWWVRRHAAYALAALGDSGHTALTAAATSSPDRYARDIAQEALEMRPRTGMR